MGPLLDALRSIMGPGLRFALGGLGLARRVAAPASRVRRSPWLHAAAGALVLQVVASLVVLDALARMALAFALDDLLLVLSVILLPIALAGAGIGIGGLGWLVAALRKVVVRDPAARLDVGAAGALGLLLSSWLVPFGFSPIGSVLAVASAAAVVVAAVPGAWEPAEEALLVEA